MSEYVPTTDEVRSDFESALWGGAASGEAMKDAKWESHLRLAQFDRWLQSERARTWDEGFNAGYDAVLVDKSMKVAAIDYRVNPYRKGGGA